MEIDPIEIWTAYGQKFLKNKHWYPWHFEAIAGGILMTGAECPLITRGPRKGQPNFSKKDKSTIEKVLYKQPRKGK